MRKRCRAISGLLEAIINFFKTVLSVPINLTSFIYGYEEIERESRSK